MLTTSTILMSLGSDLPNAHQVSSDRTDAPPISFAESFDKGAASEEEMGLKLDSGKKMTNVFEGKQIVPPTKTEGMDLVGINIKADVSSEVKLHEKRRSIDKPVVSKDAILESTTIGMLSANESSHEDLLVTINAETGKVQRPSGDADHVVQKVTPEITDGDTPVSLSNPDASKIEVVTLKTPTALSKDAMATTQDQNEIAIKSKNGNTIPSKKMVENHNSVQKSEKPAKIKDKTGNIAELTRNLVEAEQKTILVPGLATHVDRQQDGSNNKQGDMFSSIDAETSERNAEAKQTPVNKFGQKPVAAAEVNSDSAKSAIVSADDSPVQKAGADLQKQGLIAPSMMDGDGVKAQTVITAGAVAGLTHVGQGVIAPTFEGTAGMIAAQSVVPKALTAEINSHTANIHTDSRSMDAAGVMEETHQTLMATPTSLEVGVSNGTHGWLKIRAEMTAGGVNASLLPTTSSGQEMLHRELPSLTAYLQSERVAVNNIVLQPVSVLGSNSQQLASGMNDGGRGQMPQSHGQGGQQNRQGATGTVTNYLERDESYREAGKDRFLPSISYARGGRWLNVRA